MNTNLITQQILNGIFSLFILFPTFAHSQNFEMASNTPFYEVKAGTTEFADIDNDGDQDVILVGNRRKTNLPQNENYVAVLYKNDGLGNFTEVMNTPFIGLEQSDAAFADVDGDNDLDLMIIGIDFLFDPYTTLYLNDGTGNFSPSTSSVFEDVYAGDIQFADIDNDQDIDVFISGSTEAFEAISSTELYINDGTGLFIKKENTPFSNAQESSLGVEDFDNDGDLDLLLLGTSETPGPITEAYLNDGSGNYTLANQYNFDQLSSGNISFSDIDNDGDKDLLIAGTTDGGLTPYTMLYQNDGQGNFIEDSNSLLTNLKFVSTIFCDFNNDGYEDLLMTGKSTNTPDIFSADGKEAILYMNNGSGVFDKQENHPFPDIDLGHLSFADVNGDNLNDVLVTGTLDEGLTFYSGLFLNTSIVNSTETSSIITNEMKIYPNPSHGNTMHIELNNSSTSFEKLRIVDMLGRIVHQGQPKIENGKVTLDISSINSGTYTIILESPFLSISKMIIVEH